MALVVVGGGVGDDGGADGAACLLPPFFLLLRFKSYRESPEILAFSGGFYLHGTLINVLKAVTNLDDK